MTALCTSLAVEMQHDFVRAQAQLGEARLQQAEKDTPATRAAVTRWLTLIDAVLDMYLDMRGPGTRRGWS
ncbi:hypothetical protein [Geodermatophilus sabuli]|uniref:Uncharacterized protein n=1 Tax=Geodermatophilus sabuli TaxID=1564158 RepID=A0A285EF13_9ACTN|nr:hypothetical protein [Geodermatophilus sabuli]MBB3084085.1 hypothetical protein [Geodermatophilus sabuli]SNX96641.1 hypothetical protein SAMN06893097_104356 [Geodermatophilus sabuli]